MNEINSNISNTMNLGAKAINYAQNNPQVVKNAFNVASTGVNFMNNMQYGNTFGFDNTKTDGNTKKDINKGGNSKGGGNIDFFQGL